MSFKHRSTAHRRSAVAACLIGMGSLAGCGTAQQQAGDLMQGASTQIAQAQQKAALPTPVTTTTPAAWLMGQSIKVETLPVVLTQKVSYRPTGKVSLPEIAGWITQTLGLSVNTAEIQNNATTGAAPSALTAVSAGASPGILMPPPAQLFNAASSSSLPMMALAYEGTLSGLLDLVANKAGVWWKFSDGKIHFYRTITKTVYLPALERKSTGSSSIVASAGASSGTNSTGTNNAGATSNNNEYGVYVWSDIEKTAKTVAGVSAGGSAQVVASAALGSITVTGTPIQVRNVEEWARDLANNLSQQVAITLSIYSVDVKDEDNYQWDPTVIFSRLSSNLGVSISGPQGPAIQSGKTPFKMSVGILNNGVSDFSGSKLAYQALSTLGTVSDTFSQTVVTQNGQPAPIQMGRQVTYMASSSTSQTANVGSTESLTPGTVTTGITAMFLPRIVNGKILLSMNLTNSALDGPIATFTSASGKSSIQTPIISSSTFQQSVSLTPGDALLLTGLQQDNGQTSRSGVGSASNWLLGGGIGAFSGKKIIAVVVTAKVL